MKLKSKYWLTTDTHFGHHQMVKYCGRPINFEEKILSGLEKNVGPDDTIIHLGDLGFGGCIFQQHLERFMKINCARKWLAIGNHDKKSLQWYLDSGFDFASRYIDMDLYGKRILFSHIPSNEIEKYDINIHGHFHNTDFRKHEPHIAAYLCDKHALIALEDVNYQPVHLFDLIEKRGKKK